MEKVVLAGAYGKLGSEILKVLVERGYDVVAADVIDREVEGVDKSAYAYRKLDAAFLRACESLELTL